MASTTPGTSLPNSGGLDVRTRRSATESPALAAMWLGTKCREACSKGVRQGIEASWRGRFQPVGSQGRFLLHRFSFPFIYPAIPIYSSARQQDSEQSDALLTREADQSVSPQSQTASKVKTENALDERPRQDSNLQPLASEASALSN